MPALNGLVGNILMIMGAFGEYYTKALGPSLLVSVAARRTDLHDRHFTVWHWHTAGGHKAAGRCVVTDVGGFLGLLLLTYLVIDISAAEYLLLDIAWIVLSHSLWSGGRASSARELFHGQP